MSNEEIVATLKKVIRVDLDNAEQAIKNGDDTRALSEIDDAVRRLKKIIAALS
jgi:hypothetical protein